MLDQSPTFVTGLWLSAARRRLSSWNIKQYEKSLALLSGQNLVAYYDTNTALDFLRHLSFEHQIGLVAIPMPATELPANRHMDAFLERFRAYSISQERGDWAPNPFESGWVTYWKYYKHLGENSFRIWLSTHLSKVELTARYAPEMSEFASFDFTWVDLDFCLRLNPEMKPDLLFEAPSAEAMNYFGSELNYLGHPMTASTHFMAANFEVWQDIHEKYEASIERIGHFPYAYNADIVLNLTKAQHPDCFVHVLERKEHVWESEILLRQA